MSYIAPSLSAKYTVSCEYWVWSTMKPYEFKTTESM